MKIKQQDIIEYLEQANMLEVSKLIKTIEDRFNVTAAQPVAINSATKVEEEEQTEFEVILNSYGAQKIQVIKAVRELTGLGLMEAKVLVDGAPVTLEEKATDLEAERLKVGLEAVGAEIFVN